MREGDCSDQIHAGTAPDWQLVRGSSCVTLIGRVDVIVTRQVAVSLINSIDFVSFPSV